MTTTRLGTTKISATDRLIFTLFISIMLNLAIILGIGFAAPDFTLKKAEFPTIDVTLIETSSDNNEVPDDTELLAQANQTGAGNTDKAVRPSTQQTASPLPVPLSGESQILQPEQSPQKSAANENDILTSYLDDEKIHTEDKAAKNPAEQPSAAELITLGREVARLSAEINQSLEIYSKRPKHRFVAASTKEYRDAAYLDAWRRKIERIGTMNYPDEAKRHHLSGNVLMDVAIRQDGTIQEINILSSSGQKLLDDAAVRIVRLAAPFAPLPPEMRKDTDILHITRTWKFEAEGNVLKTR
ncbi:MAG TPA: energy transducer TonB [Candidatus Tenderia sp.]|nr:energy transducer TonB [Candidatus Tenderia sp.]